MGFIYRNIKAFRTNVRLFGWKKALKMAQRGYLHQHFDTYLSPIDFMVPLDGKVTIGQLIIVSRMLDIERIRKGEDSYWEMHLAHYHRNRNFSDEEIKDRQTYFRNLVQTLDQKGWDFNVRVVTMNEEPLFSFDGTHKLAYALLEKPQQVLPCTSRCDGWSMCKEDGVDYLKKKGVDDKEISTLMDRYNRLMADVDYSRFIIIRNADFNESKTNEVAKNLGIDVIWNQDICLAKSELGRVAYNRDVFRVLQGPCKILKINTDRDTLNINMKKKRITSEKIEVFLNGLNIKNYYYTPTITEANQIRIVLGQFVKL